MPTSSIVPLGAGVVNEGCVASKLMRGDRPPGGGNQVR